MRVGVRNLIKKGLNEESLKFKSIISYSSPTRLAILIKEIPEKIQIPSKEIKGPKVGVLDDILNSFLRSHNTTKNDVYEKESDKGKFYFLKTNSKEILSRDLLIKIILNSIASINWKKSMKWSDNNLIWGRPLRSILAIYNKKVLSFKYGHLKSSDKIILNKNLSYQYKNKSFNEYHSILKSNKIIIDQEQRKKIILKNSSQFVKIKILLVILMPIF